MGIVRNNTKMFLKIAWVILVAAYISPALSDKSSKDIDDDRNKKHFSLFSVVTFKNEECTSTSTIAGGSTAGTCYSTTECSDKKGTSSGNCASGFGVCCVFLDTTQTSSTITENRTRLRNTLYPSYSTSTASETIAYTLSKMSSDICQIRLDFTTFVIAGPANSLENIVAGTQNHNCLNDKLTIVPTGQSGAFPTICGTLTGEHLYVELSPTASDSAVVTILTGVTTANQPAYAIAQRIWDIKVAQIPCYANYRAPVGCHQYLTTTSGKITSLNFYKISGSTPGSNLQNSGLELASQFIKTCIRRSKGMCCVEFAVCITDTQSIALIDTTSLSADAASEGNINEGWSIDTDVSPFAIEDVMDNASYFDAQCWTDYVEIPSSSTGRCGGALGTKDLINSRYCGARFAGSLPGVLSTVTSANVCDCSEPFYVRHGSDSMNDDGGEALGVSINNLNAAVAPRGFCLDFHQEPCHF